MMFASELVEQLRGMDIRRDWPSDELWAMIERMAEQYARTQETGMAFWTYRCSEAKPELYGRLIDHWRAMAVKFHPTAAVYVAGGRELNMLKRCMAMCAFVHSPAFSVLTAFMDNDAFPNADLSDVPIDKIGLTERQLENFMPINEGVIFARPSEEARAFFRAYVGTFERLVNAINIENKGTTWWGGQIALNLLRDMPGVTVLPCDPWNFSPEVERAGEYEWGDFDDKRVIHVKGKWWKRHLEHVKRYQEARCA
jgi:hypothetical protein